MEPAQQIAAVTRSSEVTRVLGELCALTDMGFAAVARVTEASWLACQVVDRIHFGLEAGGELVISTTICNEIRQNRKPVFIDCASRSIDWQMHPTPLLYGFQSYVSVPLLCADGSFFGTLCAIDPEPRTVDTPEIRAAVARLADRVVAVLDGTLVD